LNDITSRRSDLATVLPPSAVDLLLALPQYLHDSSKDKSNSKGAESAFDEGSGKGKQISDCTTDEAPSSSSEMVIASVLIRRYRSDNHRPCFQFHTDDHTCTVSAFAIS